jgi:GDP-L-fucose synthase
MVGSAIVRRLERENVGEIIIARRAEVDLRRQDQVEPWLNATRPDTVFLPAAKVGGILANSQAPADFLYDNLMIAANLIHAAHQVGVRKLLFLGSSCIYPKFAPQPIPEEALLTGALEPTNQWYAIAKIAGIKLCQSYRMQHGADFISAMPTNLYGPGDNYDLNSSHVIPALIRKAHEARLSGAKSMEIWGTGSPRREFLHVDDCADALVHLMKVYSGESHVNVGSGDDVTIEELARTVMAAVGFDGELTRDLSKPDGTPRKLMAADRLRSLGWHPSITLDSGIAATYRDWLAQGGANDRRSA